MPANVRNSCRAAALPDRRETEGDAPPDCDSGETSGLKRYTATADEVELVSFGHSTDLGRCREIPFLKVI